MAFHIITKRRLSGFLFSDRNFIYRSNTDLKHKMYSNKNYIYITNEIMTVMFCFLDKSLVKQ